MNNKCPNKWRRLAAFIINFIIFCSIFFVVYFSVEYISSNILRWLDYPRWIEPSDGAPPIDNNLMVILGLWHSTSDYIIFTLSPLVYITVNKWFLRRSNNQTFGKYLLNLTIIDKESGTIQPSMTFKRYLLFIFAYLIFFNPILYESTTIQCILLIIFFDGVFIFRKDRRCLHDLIAGTKVVSSEKNR